MDRAKHLCAVLALALSAPAAAQAPSYQACEAEIHKTEVSITEARKRPEYRTDKGRHVLSTADRWVNQARQHMAKGEARNCVAAAQKAQTQLSAR